MRSATRAGALDRPSSPAYVSLAPSTDSPGAPAMLRNVLLLLAAALSVSPFVGCKAKSTAKYKIAVIPKGQTHEFWQSIERGCKAAAKDLSAEGLSVEILWYAPLKESDAQDQIGRVQRNVA